MKLKLLSVADAFEAVTGTRHHPSTLCRWALRGAGGNLLRTWVVGNKRMTTLEAVEEFVQARTIASTPQEPVSRVRAKLNAELAK